MNKPSLEAILDAMNAKGHVVFRNPKGLDLNIVGIRSADMRADTFNDWLTIFHIDGRGAWWFEAWPCTTDPGVYWRKNPMRLGGTAILKPDQYRGAYQLGLHRGYEALVQTGMTPVTIYRDRDRDSFLDPGNNELTGYFGINIHRASPTRSSQTVDMWSAGCQVFQSPDNFGAFLDLCRKSAKMYGKYFTYTLLTESDLAGGGQA